ncbi:MAG TPA: putative glycolipid-binding domain-containing protein [Chloroflexota bacterium]|jgi:hypothetical protein
MNRQVRWAATQVMGLEHLVVRSDQRGIHADGVVIGGDNESPTIWTVTYEVECTPDWRARRVVVVEHAGGRRLDLVGDGRGTWTDGDGRPLKSLAGCIDIDIQATPFTNTLPIRRLGLRTGASATIQVVYIPMPDLVPMAVEQRYTALGTDRWRYEQPGSGFSVELTTDPDGLVVDYPGFFRRLEEIGNQPE